MKQFIVNEVTVKGHSRSSVTIRDRKRRLHLFSDKNNWNDFKDQSS